MRNGKIARTLGIGVSVTQRVLAAGQSVMHAHGRSAIDSDGLTGDRFGQLGVQERYEMCDFLGLDESSDRHRIAKSVNADHRRCRTVQQFDRGRG